MSDQANFSIACPSGHVRKMVIDLQNLTVDKWIEMYRKAFKDIPHYCPRCGRRELAHTVRIDARS